MVRTSKHREKEPSFGLELWPTIPCPAGPAVCTRTFRNLSAIKQYVDNTGHAAPPGSDPFAQRDIGMVSGFERHLRSNVHGERTNDPELARRLQALKTRATQADDDPLG